VHDEVIKLPNGQAVIVCRSGAKQICACGRPAIALCDWKVSEHKSGTCDRPICGLHAKRVAEDKHLCPEHQRHYDQWKRRHPPAQGSLFQEAA
jgi:hypothetical protein